MKRETELSVLKDIRMLLSPKVEGRVLEPQRVRRLTVHDGMVADDKTGLTWLEDTKDFNGSKPLPWDEAMAKVKEFRFGGHKDWRLADNPVEHLSIFDWAKWKMFDVFKGARDECYWTGQVYVPNTTYAMVVGFDNGFVSGGNKTSAYYARPVRGRPWPW